jgi:hypothetical protein
MSNSVISKHSKSAFDESESITILKGLLESTREIKTFFGENDRTPNYDGTFELVNNECEPVKQFIVQIKKVDKLIQNTKGKNIGKYDYSLKTNFLQYVKDRVTECPAIYFVVDLSTKKVFWIYLSDETLMRLNFEGKKTVTYHFQETEFISDINSFILEMRHIAQERNRLFVYKTSQQISELQDAVDYLNQHLNGDLKKIKECVFPDLWRIGIKYSSNRDIQVNDRTIQVAGCVALYPQMRGNLDTGVHEYDWNIKENMFTHFSFISETDLKKYSKNTLHEIIQNYFRIGIQHDCLPTLVLLEQVEDFIEKSNCFFEKSKSNIYLPSDIRRRFVLFHNYMCFALSGYASSDKEIAYVKRTNEILSRGRKNFYDIFECARSCPEDFKKYCASGRDDENRFRGSVLGLLTDESVRWLLAILELEKRKVQEITPVWGYHWYDLVQLNKPEYISRCNDICGKLFSKLPELYEKTYHNIFDTNKYLLQNRYVYKLTCDSFDNSKYLGIESQCYQAKNFSIQMEPSLTLDFPNDDIPEGLMSATGSMSIGMFVQRRKLYYDSICCLLYRGICKGLEFEEKDLPLYEHEDVKFYL